MPTLLSALSPQALGTAVPANLYAFFRYIAQSTEAEFSEGSRWIRWHTKVAHPWFNGVLALDDGTENADSVIEEAVEYFRSRNVPNWTWWMDRALDVTKWSQPLLDHRFCFDDNTPGMAVALPTLNEDVKQPVNLIVRPVGDHGMLKEWTQTFIDGFELPVSWESNLFELMVGLGLDLPVRYYLGYLDEKPVATSNLFLAAGVAGIQFVATVAGARGRGIGSVMTLVPLLEAREMGYHVGILQSSTMGYRVYQRLGFQMVCKMAHYYWSSRVA